MKVVCTTEKVQWQERKGIKKIPKCAHTHTHLLEKTTTTHKIRPLQSSINAVTDARHYCPNICMCVLVGNLEYMQTPNTQDKCSCVWQVGRLILCFL